LYRKGLIYSYAYAYADLNRDLLSGFKEAYEIDNYLEKKNILEEFIRYAEEKGVPRDKEGIKESGLVIKTQVKAYIARNILGEDGFYPIIKEIDKTLLQAIQISKQNLLVENLAKNDSTEVWQQLP
jgi:carboxyl-terminal processing protease